MADAKKKADAEGKKGLVLFFVHLPPSSVRSIIDASPVDIVAICFLFILIQSCSF